MSRYSMAAVVLGAIAAGACFDDITGVREVSITVSTAMTVVSVGDSVLIEFEAAGTGMQKDSRAYGDGAVETIHRSGGFEDPTELPEGHQGSGDTLFYPGPVTGGGWRYHVFESPGTYRIVGYVLAGVGTASDTVNVTAN